MSIAKEKGAKTMCITCYADSPLAKLCDLPLVAVSGEAVVNKLATVSRLAQLLIVDTLCAYITDAGDFIPQGSNRGTLKRTASADGDPPRFRRSRVFL